MFNNLTRNIGKTVAKSLSPKSKILKDTVSDYNNRLQTTHRQAKQGILKSRTQIGAENMKAGKAIQQQQIDRQKSEGRKSPYITDNIMGAIDKANKYSTNYNTSNPSESDRILNPKTRGDGNFKYENISSPKVRVINPNPIRVK